MAIHWVSSFVLSQFSFTINHGASVYRLWTLPSQGSEGGFDSHKPYQPYGVAV